MERSIRQLLASKCVDSAEKLCGLHLAACARPPGGGGAGGPTAAAVKAYMEALELMGDILREKAQYKRALAYYRQAVFVPQPGPTSDEARAAAGAVVSSFTPDV
jgi:hypothetical protein